jgi:hypothetical protein
MYLARRVAPDFDAADRADAQPVQAKRGNGAVIGLDPVAALSHDGSEILRAQGKNGQQGRS